LDGPCCRCRTVLLPMRAAAPTPHQKVRCLACLERRPEATLGQRLRSFRVARGLTQMEAGRQLGIADSALSDCEQDVVQPMWKTLVQLLEFFGPELVTLGITKKA